MDERLIRLFAGELTDQEKADTLRALLDDKALKEQYKELKNIHALLTLSDYPEDRSDYISLQYKHLRKNERRHKLLVNLAACLKYAAVLAIIILITHKITLYNYKDLPEITNTLYVPGGQRVCLSLQDGTRVWLNAQSTLVYPALFSGRDRRVTVEGEAYFEVAKDEKRPFKVVSQNVELEVLGTTFNIRSYPKEGFIQTSLIEGKLRISDLQGYHFDPVMLTDKDRVTIKESEIVRDTIMHNDHFLWRDGIYSFENELLTDILKKLEIYYDVTIIVNDPTAFQWEFTGKVRQRDGIENILGTLQKLHKFSIEKDDEKNIIFLSK